MSAKVKLVSCIVGLIIAIGMLVVGVLAATQSDFLFQGNLTFAVADKSLYVRNVRYQHGMNTPQNVPGFRQGFINGGFDLNMSKVDFGDNTTGTFVLYFDIINFIVGGTTHEYIASASWTNSAVSGVSFSIDAGSEKIEKGTVTPENLTDSTPISGSVALEIFVNNTTNFDLSNITISFSQSVNLDETDYVLNDDGGITINDYTGSGSNIVIPDSYTVGGVTYPVTSIGNDTFRNNTDIQSVTLPDTITSIGENAFESCSNLTTINLPEGLTEIGENAFHYCSRLTDIVLPDTLTTIGDRAFYNCYSISGTLNIPASVSYIGKMSVILLGLTEFTVDAGSQYFTAVDGILYSKDMTRLLAYPRSKSTTDFVVPDEVLEGVPRESELLVANYKANTDEERQEIEDMIVATGNSAYASNTDIEASTKLSLYEGSIGLGAMITFIGLYLGIVFLIASAAILALKELSESTDNKERFRMLRKIGTDEKMLNRALFRQIGIFFIFPLVLAVIHSIFGIKFCTYILETFGKGELVKSIIMTAGIIVFIYGGYFLITYFASKNIIKER